MGARSMGSVRLRAIELRCAELEAELTKERASHEETFHAWGAERDEYKAKFEGAREENTRLQGEVDRLAQQLAKAFEGHPNGYYCYCKRMKLAAPVHVHHNAATRWTHGPWWCGPDADRAASDNAANRQLGARPDTGPEKTSVEITLPAPLVGSDFP